MEHLSSSRQSGQIGIIIILVMVVILTFGLSLATRSTKEIFLSQQEEESNRTFNAAEAGVEKALSTSLEFSGDSFSSGPVALSEYNSTVNYTITKKRTLETRLSEGATAHVQLAATGVPTPGSVTIHWAQDANCSQDPASIIASVYSVDTAVTPPVTKVRHLAWAACDRGDGITVAGSSSAGGYAKSFTIPLQPTDTFLRLKPIYNDTKVLVNNLSNEALPVQGYHIRSEAKSDRGNETRVVEVSRTLPAAPSVMDYVLFSGTSIAK